SGAPLWVSATLALLALAAGFGGALGAVHGHLTRRFQLANQRNPALERCLGAFERAEHAAHALVRLSAAYEQYLDWAAAIGWVLRSAPPPAGRGGEDPLDDCDLATPHAMAVAEGRTDGQRRTHLAFGVGKLAVRRGWIGACFAEFSQRQMALLTHSWWRADHEPAPDPDVEPIARRQLVGALASQDAEPPLTGWMRGRVADFLATRPAQDLFTGLDDANGQPLPDPPAAFLTAIFPPPDPDPRPDGFAYRLWRIRPGGPAITVRTAAWKPASVSLPPTIAAEDLDPREDPAAFTLLTARLDATPPMPLTDLSIFAPTHPHPPAQNPSAPTGLG
ncbi:MAG: hypothetical protein ACRDRP_19980, partial [Pseudonocardiaceae bacterium]